MRRIQRDSQHEEFIKSLTTGEIPLFREIWRILLFAAAYGVKEGKRLPLSKVESGKAMPETYFNTPAWRGFLYLLGFQENAGSDHLKNDQEQQEHLITAFEEYANFGLSEMKKKITNISDPLPGVIDLIYSSSFLGASSLPNPDIDGLI